MFLQRRYPAWLQLLTGVSLLVTVLIGAGYGLGVVNAGPEIIWQYGTTGDSGLGENQLYAPQAARRLSTGNTLIADTYNRRVIEVDPENKVVWEYTADLRLPGAVTETANGDVLIVDSEANKVIRVAKESKKVVWEYNEDLDYPMDALELGGNILISDSGHHRVIEVNSSAELVWQYGVKDLKGSGNDRLNAPVGLQILSSGNLLVADSSNNRVIEIDRKNKSVVWQFGNGNDDDVLGSLLMPSYVQRLDNGETLIADTLNNRVIIIDTDNQIIWQFGVPATIKLFRPAMAEMLSNGNILITDQHNHRVIEVSGLPVPEPPTIIEDVYAGTVPGTPNDQTGVEAGGQSPASTSGDLPPTDPVDNQTAVDSVSGSSGDITVDTGAAASEETGGSSPAVSDSATSLLLQ